MFLARDQIYISLTIQILDCSYLGNICWYPTCIDFVVTLETAIIPLNIAFQKEVYLKEWPWTLVLLHWFGAWTNYTTSVSSAITHITWLDKLEIINVSNVVPTGDFAYIRRWENLDDLAYLCLRIKRFSEVFNWQCIQLICSSCRGKIEVHQEGINHQLQTRNSCTHVFTLCTTLVESKQTFMPTWLLFY